MSQQYPQQPSPYDTTMYAPQPPQQPKKSKKWLYIGIGAAVFMIIGIAASSNDSKSTDNSAPSSSGARPTVTETKDAKDSKPKAPEQSPAEQFKAYVTKNGTGPEKAAAKHVTKVQGADGKNDILDAADIYTDLTGDLMSSDTGTGKLIASSFADWQASRGKDSKNGLVTVYNASGGLLSNGNY